MAQQQADLQSPRGFDGATRSGLLRRRRRRQLNPRQRQGLLLVVIAPVGLLGVFLLIANYVSSVRRGRSDRRSRCSSSPRRCLPTSP